MKLWPFWKSSSSFKSVIYRFRLLTLSSNVGYDLWLWKKKGNSQAQKVFKGFKDLGSTSSIHQLSFYYCLCRRMTYNHVNFKNQNSLNISHDANPTFLLWIINLNHLKTWEAIKKSWSKSSMPKQKQINNNSLACD